MRKKVFGNYGIDSLESAPAQAAKLLQGIGAMPMVRATLAQAGMTRADLEEGRTLLFACLANPASAEFDTGGPETDDAKKRRAALVELNDWDEPSFARFAAALKRRAPDAHAYLFDGLTPSVVPDEAVQSVATFLARVERLEKATDPARASTAQVDQDAVAILVARGLTSDVRKHLAELIGVALGPLQRPAQKSTQLVDVLPASDPEDARLQNLHDLRAWLDEWADTARALVKRRTDLVRLGLAHRKATKEGEEAIADTERAPGATLRLYPKAS